MATSLLICDDSSVARRKTASILPANWDITINFAANGEEAIYAIKAGKGEIVFLDLNMPVMDGYQVLEQLQQEQLEALIIVVSGDIQPEAIERVLKLGALAFLQKPIEHASQITQILEANSFSITYRQETTDIAIPDEQITIRDCYKEITNVAMGKAADLLARLLDVFVRMPIPTVNLLDTGELQMALNLAAHEDTFSAICQGFIGHGIAGEALLIIYDSSFQDIAKLMQYQGEIDNTVELELIMDIASVLIGAFLKGIADQIDVSFSQGHPVVLGQHIKVSDLIKANSKRWRKTLAIEISYNIENYNINCDLLVLLTEDSIDNLNERILYLIE